MSAPNQTPTPTAADIKAFADDIGTAIRLRHMFYLRQMDEKFEKAGGQIIYAVDSNILYQFFRMNSSEPDRQFRIASYQVFSGPGKKDQYDTERTIGRVITRYILHSLRPRGPQPFASLLLMPGHSEEAKNLYDQIADNFHEQDDNQSTAERDIRQYLTDLEKMPDETARRNLAVQWERPIFEALYKLGGPHENFREYHQLLAKQRLMGLSRAAQEPSLSKLRHANGGRHFLLDYEREAGNDTAIGSAHWWERRLKKVGIAAIFRRQDKKALVALDKINRYLQPHNARIVLLTSNELIIDQGMDYKPFKYADTPLSRYTFSDLYLRHPQCFLSEKSIVDTSRAQNNSDTARIDWLDAFLADVMEPNAAHSDVLSFRAISHEVDARARLELARNLLEYKPDRHQVLYKDWETYSSQLTNAHSSASPIAIDGIASCIRQGVGGQARVLEQFNDYVTNLTEESWNRFFLTAAQSGYELVGLSQEIVQLPKRRVPALVLREIAGGETLAKLMNETSGPTRNKEAIVAFLEKLGKQEDDKSGYVRTMGYALLFAYADRWSIAKLIAQRAAYIARRIANNPDKNNANGIKVTGREANYFASVAQRLTAKTAADLDVCDRLIGEAQRAERLEPDFVPMGKSAPTSRTTPFPPLTGLRTETEKITLDVSRLLFRHFCNDPEPLPEDQAASRARAIMARIDEVLRLGCDDLVVLSNARITLRDDYFAMVLVLENCNRLDKRDIERVDHYYLDQLNDFDKSCLIKSANQKSAYGELYISVADIVTARYAASFHEDTERLQEIIEHKYRMLEEIRDPRFRQYLMPYDRASFLVLRKFIEKREHREL